MAPRTYAAAAIASLLAIAIAATVTVPARAVPSFARQTGQPCQACHVGGFGPQLTPFGREFKLNGYTLRVNGFNLPLSGMAVASYVSTRKTPAAPAADGFAANNNVALDQASLFVAGGIGSHVGGFVQTTYDGIGKAWTWDNTDLRLINQSRIAGGDSVYGFTLNNNPGVQDPWNTLAAWGYPYTSSALAPSPTAAPLIAGGLAQEVIGTSAYVWWNAKLYLEAGAYTTPAAGTLSWLGADPIGPGDIRGLAPYGRAAYQFDAGGGTAEVGAFLLRAALRPGRDRTTPYTDHYTDTGVDASWIKPLPHGDTFTLNARYTHEAARLDATCALGIVGGTVTDPLDVCAHAPLNDLRGDMSYYWRNRIGLTVGAFDTWGAANGSIYAGNASMTPDSTGVLLQVDATPFGGRHAPLDQRLNIRVGAQYVAYTRFNGSRFNYDGAGGNAADNNTVRLFAWLAF